MTRKIKAVKKEKGVVSNAYLLNAYHDLIVVKDQHTIDGKRLAIGDERTTDSKRLAVGESVVVRPGVKDPDTGDDIAGWQGRIVAIFDDDFTKGKELVQVQWDSITLRNISKKHIAWAEEEGLSWSEMNLWLEEVELAMARDTEKEVVAAIEEISYWAY